MRKKCCHWDIDFFLQLANNAKVTPHFFLAHSIFFEGNYHCVVVVECVWHDSFKAQKRRMRERGEEMVITFSIFPLFRAS